MSIWTRLVVGVALITGVSAAAAGVLMLAAPDGHLLGMNRNLLRGPFVDYALPGAYLIAIIGTGSLLSAITIVLRSASAPLLAIGTGLALVALEIVEFLTVAFSPLQPIMLAAGLLIASWGATHRGRMRFQPA